MGFDGGVAGVAGWDDDDAGDFFTVVSAGIPWTEPSWPSRSPLGSVGFGGDESMIRESPWVRESESCNAAAAGTTDPAAKLRSQLIARQIGATPLFGAA